MPLLAGASLAAALLMGHEGLYADLLAARPQFADALRDAAMAQTYQAGAYLAVGLGAILLAGAIAAWLRGRWALKLVRAGYLTGILGFFAWVGITWRLYAVLGAAAKQLKLEIASELFVDCLSLWGIGLIPTIGMGLLLAFAHTSKVIAFYTGARPLGRSLGDRVLGNLRTHGQDPQYRKSLYASISTYLAIPLVLWLMTARGCVEDYHLPFGSGQPVVQVVQVRKKPIKKKKFILAEDSSIIWRHATLDDSEVLKDIDQETQLTYTATDPNQAGNIGRGGGKQGGWPEGMGDGRIRLIRLRYNGHEWDDGMDTISRADINFLVKFHKLTGFKVAKNGESNVASQLDDYTPGYAPPFVYMTGERSINMSGSEIRSLRKYLDNGGMLWADCGSRSWGRSFRRGLIPRLYPGEPLRKISYDDPIFQQPYSFPGGAPPMWAHDGSDVMGIKKDGRWVVVYHPGDMNDAWKSGIGVDPSLTDRSFKFGVNVVYYAFTHYLEATRKHRK